MKSINFLKTGVLMIPFILMGCQDNDILVNTESDRRIEIAAPAGDITYQVADLIRDIDNEYVFVDEEGLVNVKYTREVDIDWESLVNLRDFHDVWNYSPGLIYPINSPVNVAYTEKVKMNHRTDVRYDSLTMEMGALSAYLMVPYGTEGNITITIPEVLQDETPLSYSFYASENQRYFQITEDLSGKKMIPSQGVDSSYISVVTSLDLSNMVAGDVELEFSLMDMQPGMAFGYFGQQESARPNEKLTLDVFDELNISNNEIKLFDFYIDLKVNSEIGVPFDVVVENLRFYDESDALIDVLEVENSNKTHLALPAAVYGNPIGMSETSFHICRTNSDNIVDIVNNYPRHVLFDVTSFSNPDGETQESNFMGPSNVLQGEMDIIAPLWFRVSDEYLRTDTIDFDFNDILGEDSDDARDVESATIWFDFYSKIPVDISAVAWVVDAEGNKIDNLFGDSESDEDIIHVVQAGVPDSDTGRVMEATHTEFNVTITGDQINDFLDRNAMDIILKTKIFTDGEEDIKIYEDMSFNAVVSFKVAGNLPEL